MATGAVVGSMAIWVGAAVAATTVVVTPANQQGWSTADTRPGGTVDFVVDSTAPSGIGALQLTTDATAAAKAQYMHEASTPLADVSELGYSTKQNSASAPVGDPSYQLAVDLLGSGGGFTTLVYEPYWNGAVVPGTWQQWDVDSGLFWSSATVVCPNGVIGAGAGGPPLYTLSQIESACPDAVVTGFGVNVGTYNPGYDVETDLVDFDGTVYDFEPYQAVTSKDQCKDGGWATVTRADGSSFANQGDCIQYVNTGK
ncbi:MAG TPA: hypothetical protein VFL60_01725 [Gaiellaceae bacterium]|nr:hypothetical protein [Gaiellaceae bacterium]